MNEELRNNCYLLSLEGYRHDKIADKLGISRSAVTKAIGSIIKANDFQLAVKGCGVMLDEYVRFQDFLKVRLVELKEMDPDDNRDRLAIIRLQADLYKDLLTIGAVGDFIQNVRIMRDKLNAIDTRPNLTES